VAVSCPPSCGPHFSRRAEGNEDLIRVLTISRAVLQIERALSEQSEFMPFPQEWPAYKVNFTLFSNATASL